MKILVTGGTGFLGRCLVSELVKQHSLRLLVRSAAGRERFPAGVEFASGDVTERASLAAAATGCDAIVHAAALVKILAPEREFDRINVGGIENILAVAAEARARVLYVSSFIALGPTEARPRRLASEEVEPVDRAWINPYERTKTLADRIARAAIANGAPVDVVYPGVIYGPGELTEGNIVVRHILDLVKRKVPALLGRPERLWNYVFVGDVASGIVRALGQPPGQRYVLGGENVTQAAFYELVAELTGVVAPSRRLPDWLAKALGGMDRTLAGVRGVTPKLTPDLVEIYRHDWALDSSRAARDLGYQPRSLRAGLAETMAWLEESGAWQRRKVRG